MATSPAGQYRALLWLFTLAAIVLIYPTIQGGRGVLPHEVGLLSGFTSVLALFTGGWYGWKGAQLKIAERNRKADALAMVTIAAFLRDKSEADLEAASAKGGPVGEAARLLLERRRTGLTTRPSASIPKQPEIN